MRIFVTGGTGFIGSHFLRTALFAGHTVRALRRPKSRPRIALEQQPEWIETGLTGVPSDALAGCDAFVHFAAAGVDGKAGWEECFAVNVVQSLQLWIRAVETGIHRFVICGSCFEYGRAGERYEYIPVDAPLEPTAPYHASKAAASMAALGLAVDRNLSLTILRPFHVFGDGEDETRFWPALRAAAFAGRDFPMTKGEQVRDFVEVGEVARQFLEATLTTPVSDYPILRNIGTGQPQTIRDFAERWWMQWDARGRLLPGALSYRSNEVMRYVPRIG